MNYNSMSGSRQPLGRKVKRVSDTNAMGPPASVPQQPFNPYNQTVQMPEYQQPPPPGYNQYPATTFAPTGFPGQQFSTVLNQPMVQDMALQYGQQLANTGKQIVTKEIERYVPVTMLKYYFAVDTKYVISKLKLLLFPFSQSDWSIKYQRDEPVQPRYELNAPDLYIPTMAYVTYVLVAGLALGVYGRFSAEQIGIQASSALAWTLFEIAVYTAALYITNIQTALKSLDLLAYSGYKYVGIIASIFFGLMFDRLGYLVALGYCELSLAFFMVRTLKVQVLPPPTQEAQNGYYNQQPTSLGNKRRLYFLLFVAVMQPLLGWWLSFHLIGLPASPAAATR